MTLDEAVDSVMQHVATGRPCGHFLTAVLENDLMAAVGHADESSLQHLIEICTFVNWGVPAGCWGSRVKVAAWRAARMQEREAIP